MSTKSDYSAEEWKSIASAPVAAGLLITLSDASGPMGLAKEALAVGKAITDSAQSDGPEIVKAVAVSMKETGRPETPDIPKGDRAQLRMALTGGILKAVDAIAKHSPDEVQGFKIWLASVAKKVAEASKEGGFLGMGGTLVSDNEIEGLRDLNSALGLA